MSPFDVLKKDFKPPEETITTRVSTGSGTVVKFPPNWQKHNGRGSSGRQSKTSLEEQAPRFKLGDHQLPADVTERLGALPAHRHGR